MIIDTHCHLFSKEMLADEFLRITNNLKDFSGSAFAKRFSNAEIENIALFISHGVDSDCLDLYSYMQKAYNEDLVAVPLMLDLTYTMVNPYLETDSENMDRILSVTKSLNNNILKGLKSLSNNENNKMIASLEKVQYKLNNSQVGIFKDNYDIQIKDMVQLKETLGDRVYPFFSIDPRRDKDFEGGVLGEIKKYVGKGNPFTGLKLYTSLGYSPTNPVLYDNKSGESVYEYCEKNKIPITVHCGNEGFSHGLDRNIIDGDIYYQPAGRPIPMSHIDSSKVYNYEHGMMHAKEMIQERQLLLNHPSLWRKVLEKYPKLKMNMAHLGGSSQLGLYTMGKETGFWTKQILEIVADYKNVYTDISFFNVHEENAATVEDFYENVYLKLPRKTRKKILWGSDFFMLDLAELELSRYLEMFKQGFGEDFTDISLNNPKKFLGIRRLK